MDATIPNNGQADINSSTGKAPQPSRDSLNCATSGLKLSRRNLKAAREPVGAQASSSSSASSSSTAWPRGASRSRGIRLANKRRNSRVLVQRKMGDVEAIAFPLGMSIAAVAAQVLEKTDASDTTISADHLALLCTKAVKESLSSVFGDRFEPFARNFEKSFLSTLNTLRVIENSSKGKGQQLPLQHNSAKCIDSEESFSKSFIDHVGETEATILTDISGDHLSFVNEIIKSEFMTPSSSQDGFSLTEDVPSGQNTSSSMFRELSLHNREMSQELACGSLNTMACSSNGHVLTTIEKSVIQQTRANDLKTVEIGLAMKKLRLKETELALSSQSNFLERCKLSMGFSKASFKAEKFKTQLEETRHAELLRKCIDYLVAGLFLMSGCLFYGTYVYSYRRISDATTSCTPSADSKSWWVPKSVTGISSGLQTLRCQVQVLSRMLFGFILILIVAYLLLQRSTTPRHTMPITFILLLLGVGCGFAGKFCVDTLGGDGSVWLMYWEVLCLVHLFANVSTSILFYILHGPVKVSTEMGGNTTLFPYWIRRIIFYSALLVVIPLLCGLMPFAGPVEWKDHFSSLIRNALLVEDVEL